MVSEININYINSYREILNSVSDNKELLEKLKQGKNLLYNDIAKIASTIFVR